MSRDDEMLERQVRGVVASLTAECEARALLRKHEGDTREDIEADADERGRAETDALIDALNAAREALELDPVETGDDVADGLDELRGPLDDALEMRVEGHRTASEWQVERVRFCVGLGGPNLFVYIDDDDRAWVDGYWGGSKVEGVYFDLDVAAELRRSVYVEEWD